VGFSAGAATSVYIAAQEERVTGVAACACPADFSLFTGRGPRDVIDAYRDIGAIRDEDFPASVDDWFACLEKMVPEQHVSRIAPRPLLLVHGVEDVTVPVDHAYRLYNAAGDPKDLVILEGAGHRLRQQETAVQTVLDWLKKYSSSPTVD
jgi:dipeptidyl aminopeptidase/acylaminoacyl peptidase